MSSRGILLSRLGRLIVTRRPGTGRPVGTEASRRSARSLASALLRSRSYGLGTAGVCALGFPRQLRINALSIRCL
jgi:hypothetical protein